MGAEQGRKQLLKAQGEYAQAQVKPEAGADKSPADDKELDEGRHDRSYNPVDKAQRGTVAAEMNKAAGRYRKGPGPL